MTHAELTHAKLVTLAAQWLRRRCSVVITELVTSGEVPDVIGWNGRHSTLIECKASRADFRADGGKFFRAHPRYGIRLARYYFAPVGMIEVEELPPKWGLLEITASGVRQARKSERFYANSRQEIGILLSTLRRIGQQAPVGVGIKCYTIETERTATLGVACGKECEAA